MGADAAGAAAAYVDPAEGYVRGIRVLRLLGNIPVIRGLGASEVGSAGQSHVHHSCSTKAVLQAL